MTSYEAKKLTRDQTRDSLLEMAKKFVAAPIAPTLLFNAGEFFYDQQDYAGAQTQFELVAKNYPQSDLVPEALYYAGDAAMRRKDFTATLQILEKIPEGSSSQSSPWKAEARLLQGLVYHLQGKFENAVTLFDAALSTEKSGPIFVTATLRKGNALFALGATDSTRYEQAASTYGTLLNTSQGNFAQRNEAAYMRAKCFEKLGRTADALALYLDVLNGRMMPGDANGPTTELPPEMLWRVKAGIDAAELRKQAEDWAGTVDVYRRLESLGGPNQAEFRDAINRLRREHFLFDDEEGAPTTTPAAVPAATPATTPTPAPTSTAPESNPSSKAASS